VRVAYTLEQCWHRVPGGTGTAALALADAIVRTGTTELVGVAGRHRGPATPGFEPGIKVAHLPVGGAVLYETWLRFGWPLVESVVESPDVVHATTVIPPATRAPLVVTLHDIAFVRHPEFFTDRGNKVFARSLSRLRRDASVVMCSSHATLDDCLANGFDAARLRHVPLGVSPMHADAADVARVRAEHSLPDEFVLFVGTREPRKNLDRLVSAMAGVRGGLPLVVAGMHGWGGGIPPGAAGVHLLGHVPAADLAALYAACSVFAYPSLLEGFGMPVLEAMSAGAPVVTSAGTSTEEVAGGAAVLVDPHDVASITAGINDALARRGELSSLGRARAAGQTWDRTAALVLEAYAEAAR
jgi:glycosyltransferase involved in cell wall biosynthesis